MTDSPRSWTVVVPVKGTTEGKSRLRPDIGDDDRRRLAEAFARDAVTALRGARRVASVVVVTDPASAIAGVLAGDGARIVADPGHGLNAAITEGLRVAAETATPAETAAPAETATPAETSTPAYAVLLGDLPCLTPDEIDAALEAAAEHPLALVPDSAGTGTTLLTATIPAPPVPHFGAGSAAAHLAAGHRILSFPPTSGIRRDVDTAADLDAAVALGVGPFTRAALDALSPRRASGPSPRR